MKLAMKLGTPWARLLPLLLIVACSAEPPPAESDAPTLESVLANSEHVPGFIDSYRDRDSGELYFVVTPEQLDVDILHFASFLDGNAATYTQRGVFADESVIRLHRVFKRLQFLKQNTAFYFDPDSALARASDANVAPAVLAVADILDEDEAGRLLIAVGPVFLSEALLQIKPAQDPEAEPGFSLGDLSETRSALRNVRNYPRNTDVAVSYVYENPQPLVSGGQSQADSRFVTINVQHNLVAAPTAGYEPRQADQRVGYFTKEITDMTSVAAAPWRDAITRWRLQKKDPAAALSEPIEPIVFWLENTTPVQWRDTVRDAVLVWNQAFEDAGFINAVDVRQQPDDATWEAQDLRYNVLRWTSSLESPWGGYGPNFADPRTGEILGADIMLEFGWIQTFSTRENVFETSLSRSFSRHGSHHCAAGMYLRDQLALGQTLRMGKGGEVGPRGKQGHHEESHHEMIRQSLYDLVTHEVGHVLGLSHNFRASQFMETAQLNQATTGSDAPIYNSVMEYPSINLPAEELETPRYFLTEPGPYDRWAIQFGYTPALADSAAEAERQSRLLARSTEPALVFGLDADALLQDSGIDPRIQRFDMAADPLVFGRQRIELANTLRDSLLQRFNAPGESWQPLVNAYRTLYREHYRQLRVAARWIGGVYNDRAVQGQSGADTPFTAVPEAIQREAMSVLHDGLFAPDALDQDVELLRHLQQQRRGYRQWYRPQDPKVHAQALAMQRMVLEQLLHPVTLARVNDSVLYGNTYTLDKLLADLTVAVFEEDQNSSVNSVRQQLQREYIEQLLRVADARLGSDHDHVSRGQAWYVLENIQESLQASLRDGSTIDTATRAHRLALQRRIELGLAPAMAPAA
ncbi:MAG: zinc-dependent metalloprotease [Pseudomonadota bacterium]